MFDRHGVHIMQKAAPSRVSILQHIAEERSRFDFGRDVPEGLKADPDVVLAALADARIEWEDIPVSLHEDRRVCMAFAHRGWEGLRVLPDRWKDDRDFVLELMRDEPCNFQHASERLRGDREVAIRAVAATRANNF